MIDFYWNDGFSEHARPRLIIYWYGEEDEDKGIKDQLDAQHLGWA